MTAALLLAVPLARTGEGMKSGPIGLGIILILCIACYFLFKSMSKHLKTVREDFPLHGEPKAPTVPATPVGQPTFPATPVEQRADGDAEPVQPVERPAAES